MLKKLKIIVGYLLQTFLWFAGAFILIVIFTLSGLRWTTACFLIFFALGIILLLISAVRFTSEEISRNKKLKTKS